MDTGRFTVDSQEDMTTWRQVRVCFLCLLGLIQLCLDTTFAKLLRGKVILVKMLVSLPLPWMKNVGV